MKIAHEAPISILKEVQGITDYDYALVHLFETHCEYLDFFIDAVKLNRDVLLDNSIFELGTAFDSDKFAEWIVKLNPTRYVVPDVLEDCDKTIKSFSRFTKKYDLKGLKIGAVQGKTYNELVECYKFMEQNADMVAISFDLSYYDVSAQGANKLQRQKNGRIKFIRDLIRDNIWNKDKPVHLLGASLASEFSFYRKFNINIYSCDTSNPVVAGMLSHRYLPGVGLGQKPSVKLADLIDEDVSKETLELISDNIWEFRAIASPSLQ